MSVAVFSPCRRYRYALWRETGVLGADGVLLFVMLNPSTADETNDDPTIRRCIGFARDWGFERLAIANLFGLRSTDPAALLSADDPIGPGNDAAIDELDAQSTMTVCAWGAHPAAAPRADDVLNVLRTPTFCLGTTKAGHPKHPLYVPAAQVAVPL